MSSLVNSSFGLVVSYPLVSLIPEGGCGDVSLVTKLVGEKQSRLMFNYTEWTLKREIRSPSLENVPGAASLVHDIFTISLFTNPESMKLLA